MGNNNNSSGGIGFLGLLSIVFIMLKLTNNIDWPWGWVLCPLWGVPLLFLIGFGVVALVALIRVKLFSTPSQREQMKRIMEDQKRNAGKSKWQQRVEEMQKAQQLRNNK